MKAPILAQLSKNQRAAITVMACLIVLPIAATVVAGVQDSTTARPSPPHHPVTQAPVKPEPQVRAGLPTKAPDPPTSTSVAVES